MNKRYEPKLLTTDAAITLADLHMVFRDLTHVKDCCDLILALPIEKYWTTTSTALHDSIAIRYRRCFKVGGSKRRYLPPDLPSLVSTEGRKIHEDVLAVASSHIAHSVNAFELQGTVVHVAVQDGKVFRSGIGGTGLMTIGLGVDLTAFSAHLVQLEKDVLDLIEQHQKIVSDELAAMSDEEITALRDGFPPNQRTVKLKSARDWPL